jgi:uncharacterized protein
MKETVLITGASSGIGYELAHLFARDGYKLIIVARRPKPLQKVANALAEAYKVQVLALSADLTDIKAVDTIVAKLKRKRIHIDVLVNNAGFGKFGEFTDSTPDQIQDMMNLNMNALTHLARLLLPDMLEKKSGKILNVASMAAFQPGPMAAVYFATKAYVLSLSEALAEELCKSGVSVSVLCPGPTAKRFSERAGWSDTDLYKGSSMTASEVAQQGYKGLMEKKSVIMATPLSSKLLVFLQRFAPRKLVAHITGNILRK